MALSVVFRTERQAYRIPKCIRKGEEETDEHIHWKRLCPFFFIDFLKWRFPRRLTPSRWQSRDNWNIPSEGNWDVLTHLFWQSGNISLTNLPNKTVAKKSCQLLSSSNALSPNFPNFFLSRGWQKSRDNTALIYTRWPPNLLTIPCRITKKLHVE